MALPSRYGIDKNMNSMAGLSAYENGGKGSGNFGHAGRPGERGGSSASGSGISKAVATQKKFQDQAKIVREDIEDRIGQKVKKGEEYTALDEASKSRFKEFHGEDGTEYTYDKGNGMITKTNPETGDQEVVTKQKDTKDKRSGKSELEQSSQASARAETAKELLTSEDFTIDEKREILKEWEADPIDKKFYSETERGYMDALKDMVSESKSEERKGKYEKRKDYKAEQKGVDVRDGHRIGAEFADLERELGNARTNLKMLKKDKETAYTDSAARSRYLDRSSAIARTIAQATSFGPSSKETKKLVKEMTKELRDIYDEYVEVGTKKYFDPDLNVER